MNQNEQRTISFLLGFRWQTLIMSLLAAAVVCLPILRGHTEAALVTDQGYIHLWPRGQGLNTRGRKAGSGLRPASVNL